MIPLLRGLVRLPFVILVTFFCQRAASARSRDLKDGRKGSRTLSRAVHRHCPIP
jgi:hypothetical protein